MKRASSSSCQPDPLFGAAGPSSSVRWSTAGTTQRRFPRWCQCSARCGKQGCEGRELQDLSAAGPQQTQLVACWQGCHSRRHSRVWLVQQHLQAVRIQASLDVISRLAVTECTATTLYIRAARQGWWVGNLVVARAPGAISVLHLAVALWVSADAWWLCLQCFSMGAHAYACT